MEIPENWQEELMLHDWKMMKIDRCRSALYPERNEYKFPNGIQFSLSQIKVDFERANIVKAALSDYEPKMNVKKGIATFELNWRIFAEKTKGELDDLLWLLYSLDI